MYLEHLVRKGWWVKLAFTVATYLTAELTMLCAEGSYLVSAESGRPLPDEVRPQPALAL